MRIILTRTGPHIIRWNVLNCFIAWQEKVPIQTLRELTLQNIPETY